MTEKFEDAGGASDIQSVGERQFRDGVLNTWFKDECHQELKVVYASQKLTSICGFPEAALRFSKPPELQRNRRSRFPCLSRTNECLRTRVQVFLRRTR